VLTALMEVVSNLMCIVQHSALQAFFASSKKRRPQEIPLFWCRSVQVTGGQHTRQELLSCKVAALSRADYRESPCEVRGKGMETVMWKWGWEMLEV